MTKFLVYKKRLTSLTTSIVPVLNEFITPSHPFNSTINILGPILNINNDFDFSTQSKYSAFIETLLIFEKNKIFTVFPVLSKTSFLLCRDKLRPYENKILLNMGF